MGRNEVEIVVKSKDQTAAGTKSAKKNINEVGRSTKRVGDIAKGVLASGVFDQIGEAAARGLRSTFDAANDLGESVNAVGKIFGDNADQVLQWGRENAAAFGLSERAFNQSVTPMGAILKNAGLEMDAVTGSTLDLTQRAADMASVFNTDVETALDAINSGLKGEADPLEAFGVGLSAAAVEAHAMSEGISDGTGELTNQEKALARVSLIMKQTSDVAGDFADTSGDAANAQRIATAEMENAQAAIGQHLLPLMAGLAKAGASVAQTFSAMPGPIQGVIGVVGLLGAGFLVLAPRIMAAKAAMESMGMTMPKAGSKMKAVGRTARRVAGTLGGLMVAGQLLGATLGESLNPQLEALQLGLQDWSKNGKMAGEMARLFSNDTDLLASSLMRATDTGFDRWLGGTIETVTGAGNAFDESFSKAEERVDALDAALAQMVSAGQTDEAAAAFQRLAKVADEQGISIETLRSRLPQYSGALEVAGNKAEEGAGKVDKHSGSMKKNAGASEEAKEALKEYADAQRAATDPVFALMSAIQGADDAQKAYTDAVKEHGAQSKQAKNAAVDMAKAVAGVESAALDGDISFGKFREKLKQWVSQGAITERQAGQIAGRVKAARREAQRYKGRYNASVTADTAQASRNISALQRQINALQDRTIFITQRYQTTGSRITGLAHGGISGGSHAAEGGPRGRTTLVGEQGPELLDLPPGTQVHSNPDTERKLDSTDRNAAVREILRHLRSGGQLFEDFSFRGDSDRVGRFNDQLSRKFHRSGQDFNRQNVAQFLRDQLREQQEPRRRERGEPKREPIVIELRSSGSRLDDLLLEILRHAIKVRGGDVQVVLGRN